ncbi:addiction module toxin, HicA family protein [Clostridia bacterium]|nr:addiction module toxin, HicA family protein [Clostridia bacterium]
MKTHEFIRLIKDDGWRLYEHGKKHDKYRHPTKPGTIIVPRHAAEIRSGLCYAMLKDAGIKQ